MHLYLGVTKIRTNLNLNFSLYCATEVVGVWESLMLLVNSLIFSSCNIEIKCGVYRRAAIIEGLRAGRSETEIIRLFRDPEINRLWRCDKIFSFRIAQRKFQYASEEKSLEKTHREDHRSHWKGSSADFEWSRAIVAKISIDCKRANNANCRELSIQIVHIKDALWGC